MESILLIYACLTYLIVGIILVCARHEIEMVHLRNPLRYPMDKVIMIVVCLWVFSPISIYWLLYEIWADKKANS